MLTYFILDVDSEMFTIDILGYNLSVRWYGVLFVLGFLIGQQILFYIFRKDGKPSKEVDAITIYVIVGTVIGARLGHYLFYEWEHLFRSPGQWFLDLIIPPYSGLASHGAAVGILVGLYLYSRRRSGQSFLWVVDRVVITVALGAALIRLGNFMNSEIYGKVTSLPWGVIFVRETNPAFLPVQPRHPTQLYEAGWYMVVLAVTFYLWKFKRSIIPEGTIAGVFMILLFSFRFFVEFLKNTQVEFENDLVLNMGQVLSIPVILMGIVILVIVYRRKTSVIHSSTPHSDSSPLP